jgi:glycosyltransferase involved in cell wall biosynthesis
MHNKIILIDNYVPDKQESMKRFATMLKDGFETAGLDVEVRKPVVFFGAIAKSTVSGYGKWLGYLDKWILYPLLLLLKRVSEKKRLYHICDHSNAPYLKFLPKSRTSITCHDVLAIRGALGHKDAYCDASAAGKVLQNWILKNLLKAEKIATVSQLTFDQLKDLNNGAAKPQWKVIHNGFNAGFKALPEHVWKKVLQDKGCSMLANNNYIFHVGSNLPRKNRTMLIEMVAALGQQWVGLICFAGQAIDDDLRALFTKFQLNDRVIEVINPGHDHLEALLNGAQAFVFPSFSEGFGWPVIEAQACETPVLASSLRPMPEVGGNAAVYANPYEPADFAKGFLKILDTDVSAGLKQSGLENIKRFNTNDMIAAYLKLMNIN